MAPLLASMNRAPYSGPRETIAIAIDVGTTYSGATYAILRPGEIPQVQGVTRYPGQPYSSGDSKVPSIIYYDRTGRVRAAGAETEDDNTIADAEEEGWYKVEHFKLRLRPAAMTMDTHGLKLGDIPPFKTAMQVFGDFLAYMLKCTMEYIHETHTDGPALWARVKDHVDFILTHPNGWEGSQQQVMRQSAVHGGLIPNTDEGRRRITFLSEGEASLHACLSTRLGGNTLQPGDAFVVADAGGGTLDVNTYEVIRTQPLDIHEVVSSDCRFAGSVFVNMRARELLEEKLRGSKFSDPKLLDDLTSRTFDRTTKRLFADTSVPSWVQVGNLYDRDAARGIRGGKLKLAGEELAKCFEFSVEQICQSVLQQKDLAGRHSMDVWLVGGFAASPWLFEQMKSRLTPRGLTIYRPDANTSKAVANGAISFFLDRFVKARVARLSTGIQVVTKHDPFSSEHAMHLQRGSHLTTFASGTTMIGPQFRCFIEMGKKITELDTVAHAFYQEITSRHNAELSVDVLVYRGGGTPPGWMDTDKEKYKPLCSVQADLHRLCGAPQFNRETNTPYWRLEFEVVFKFGLTEYTAQLKWVEDGITKFGPVSMIYETQE